MFRLMQLLSLLSYEINIRLLEFFSSIGEKIDGSLYDYEDFD